MRRSSVRAYGALTCRCRCCCLPQVVVTKLKLDKDRKALLERKRAGKGLADKGKFSEAEVAAMENVE